MNGASLQLELVSGEGFEPVLESVLESPTQYWLHLLRIPGFGSWGSGRALPWVDDLSLFSLRLRQRSLVWYYYRGIKRNLDCGEARAARAREMALFLWVRRRGPRCVCGLSITVCWRKKLWCIPWIFYFIFQTIFNFPAKFSWLIYSYKR